MPCALVLGGYGAVGQHAARALSEAGVSVLVGGRRAEPAERLAEGLRDAKAVVVDAVAPGAVQAAAERVDVVVNCSGRETVELVNAVVAGGAHLVDVSASYAFQHATARRLSAAGRLEREVLFSVGVAPGLTNLLAADLARDPSAEPIELLVVLGVGEEHGRAARDWVYGLLGEAFPDTATTGGQALVRNFSGGTWRRIPGMGPVRVYRVDFSDQHRLTVDLGRPVRTWHGFDSWPVTMALAGSGRLPGAQRVLRALEPMLPWSWFGGDRWVVAAGCKSVFSRWVSGRNQSRATGIVAALATTHVLDGLHPG